MSDVISKQFNKTIVLDVVPTNNTPATITLQVDAGSSRTINLSNSGGGGSGTSDNTPDTLVLRDGSGGFSAGLINASITGSASSATSISGNLSGDVTSSGMVTSYNATVPVAKGGTNSTTALNNNRIMKSSGGAIVEAAVITGNKALASDANGIPVHTTVTDTELGYVSGVTSAIQTQINGKQASLGFTPENVANKATDFSTVNDTLYPTVKAVDDAIAGITISTGDLTTSTTGVDIVGGTDAVVGSGTTIDIDTASGSQPGLLSSADWTTFNSKQAAGNYVTALTGDVTASGPGSVAATLSTVNSNVGSFGSASSVGSFTVNGKGLVTAASDTSIQIAESQVTNLVSDLAGKQATGNYITALTGDITASGPGSASSTLATVNSNTGSFGSSTAIPNFTVNGKGLITAAGTNAVVAPAGTLTGTTLASNVVTSSLTSVGTIGTGTWNGTTIAIANGGTGQTSAANAINALVPTQSGNSGKFLKTDGSVVSWDTASGGSIGSWTSYTPTFNNTGSTSSVSFYYQDVGGVSLNIRGTVDIAAGGSGSDLEITLPMGYTVNSSLAFQFPVGNGRFNGASGNRYSLEVTGGNTFFVLWDVANSGNLSGVNASGLTWVFQVDNIPL